MLTFKKSNNKNNFTKYEWLADKLLGWILVVGAILGWWAISQTISDLVMPGPIAVGKTLVELFFDPIFLDDILISTIRVIGSVIISVLLGMVLALLPRNYPKDHQTQIENAIKIVFSSGSCGRTFFGCRGRNGRAMWLGARGNAYVQL